MEPKINWLPIFILWFCAQVFSYESESEVFLTPKNDPGISVKIPRLMKRYYEKWSSAPQNNSNILHSIPVEVKEIEDDALLMTAPYRANNYPILRAHLLIEFSDYIPPSQLQSKKYYIELVPDTGHKTGSRQGCSSTSAMARSRCVDNLLEMKFNIKHFYAACRRVNKKTFSFKLRLLGIDGQPANIDLRSTKNDVFILLKEGLKPFDSISIIPPGAVEKTLEHIRNLSAKIRRSPHIPDLEGPAKERIQKRKGKRFEKMEQRAPQMRHYMRPWRKDERKCQIRNLNVNFRSIGWDWVVAPQSYDVRRCFGRCSFPMPDHFNSTGHAVLQTIVYSIMGTPPGACCVPKELDSLTFLYVDGNSIALRTFPDMVVKSCACL